ncbi:diguanylate cyclase (GGDEF) domain-containing protein [Formivibrio citricus]|uniref:diguanylate cyclase n=1 Tax=Formivibrio citricus TaxID=83765 RepID=A0A1I4VVX2_9NEIS|nr:biofilm regulation diguanylate cyclase SiaD [Formivibrio citricus]SFN05310.1 diguanylate cyclase (GGDEF) domain-containing protein [Formivibrio citricus]
MSDKPSLPQIDAEKELIRHIETLLADPAHEGNPLREPLARLLEQNAGQRQRLERLVRISDGYHLLSRANSETLSQQYDRQLRRVEKLMRISDRYQQSLREISEALREASLHDPLTSLGNRRFLMERLGEETGRAVRNSTPYSLGIIDIDFFKSINDRYGHDAGDKALCEVSCAIRDSLREYDICGRWGGEEFLFILPETPLDLAVQVAERVRLGIENIRHDHIDYRITACIGVTLYRYGEHYSDTIKRADEALRHAKEAGRNRVESRL